MQGGVFICYRREDSAGFAGRIYDRLKASLGRDSVFIDVDNIPAGRDFVEVLSEHVGRCDALIAVIGRKWLASADNDSRRRLDDPTDFVRIEIEAALARNVPVIPVLVDGAAMPRADDLPDVLKKLARRQGIEISHNRFDSDAERLTDALARIDWEKPGCARAVAAAGSPARSEQGSSAMLWALALSSGLVVAGGAAAFLYEQHREQGETVGQEEVAREKAKPTSDITKSAPAPQTGSTANDTPPSPAPGGANNSVASDAPANPPQWMSLADFKADFQQRIGSNYPDRAWGRCRNGVLERGAHWSPRLPGHDYTFRPTKGDEAFKSDATTMSSRGYTMQYDNVSQNCDGTNQHQTLWVKEQ
jgi:TIR domain